jgi:hypothetical protein
MNIFRPKYLGEYIQTKIWRKNIQTKILDWKYSDQRFGVKIFGPKYGVEVFRPKFWHENIHTSIWCIYRPKYSSCTAHTEESWRSCDNSYLYFDMIILDR